MEIRKYNCAPFTYGGADENLIYFSVSHGFCKVFLGTRERNGIIAAQVAKGFAAGKDFFLCWVISFMDSGTSLGCGLCGLILQMSVVGDRRRPVRGHPDVGLQLRL